MDGLDLIRNSIKEMMEELFDNCTERNGILRSMAGHLGVTDTDAIVDVLLESGFDDEAPYPVLHFMVTLAKDIADKDAGRISIALNELNHIIAVGDYPSFGAFSYYPKLHQIFLSYRLPVNPEVPEEEIINDEVHQRLMQYIDELPSLYKDVMIKYMIEELEYEEIAQELGLELNTVRTRIRRGKQHLAQMMLRGEVE